MMLRKEKNSAYRYDRRYRFYGWENAEKIRPVVACGCADLGEFYLACLAAWSEETCTARMRGDWSKENPTAGQCSITAFLVQEFFGGEIMGLPLEDGGMHCFNRIDGVIVDLACEQFGKDSVLNFEDGMTLTPEAALGSADKRERAALLRKNLGTVLEW